MEAVKVEFTPKGRHINELAMRHLTHSLNLIAKQGWTTGAQARKNGNNHRVSPYNHRAAKFSMLGAHNNGVFCLMREDWNYRRLVENQAATYLRKAIESLPALEGIDIYERRDMFFTRNEWMQAWNDHPARTSQQVKIVFEYAILLAKQDIEAA